MTKKSRQQIEQQEEFVTDEKLSALNLRRKPLPKDGSCLFRACSEQLFHTQIYHKRVRSMCVDYLQKNKEFFEHYIVEMPFNDYCKWMRQDDRWGSQIELECIAQAFKCNIRVYSVRGVEAEHTSGKDNNWIQLCFLHGNHYDSVYDSSHFQNTIICQEIFYELLEEKLQIEMPPIPDVHNAWNVVGVHQHGHLRNIEYDLWKEQLNNRHEKDMKMAISLSNKKKKFPQLKSTSPAAPTEQTEQPSTTSTWGQKDWKEILTTPPPPAVEEPIVEPEPEPVVPDVMPISDSHDLTIKKKKKKEPIAVEKPATPEPPVWGAKKLVLTTETPHQPVTDQSKQLKQDAKMAKKLANELNKKKQDDDEEWMQVQKKDPHVRKGAPRGRRSKF